MKFWDSSALLPLVLIEATSEVLRAEYLADPQLIVWWATYVECHSALARRHRLNEIDDMILTDSVQRLDELSVGWQHVPPDDKVQARAVSLVRSHPLRAADSLQLAAALIAVDSEPSALPFVTLDARLRSGSATGRLQHAGPESGPWLSKKCA